MRFKFWLKNEGNVLFHVAGPSGAGKSTLAEKLSKLHSNVVFKDLDDFDDEAEVMLGWSNIRKNNYTDKMILKLGKLRQKLMDDFINKNDKPIVFVGNHMEGDHVLYIPTKNRFLLNVDAKTSAWRAYERSQKEDPKYRRTLEELPGDEQEAQETIDDLLKKGYKPLSYDQIVQWMNDYHS